MTDKKITFQLEILKRHDSHITSANTKSGMILSFSATYLGILIALTPYFWNLNNDLWFRLAFVITILSTSIGLIVTIVNSFFAIFPNTAAGSQRSLISFVHTSNFDGGAEAYRQAVINATDEDKLKDLCYQSFVLSQIASEKFANIKNAVMAIKLSSLASTVLIICIVVGSLLDQESSIKKEIPTQEVSING